MRAAREPWWHGKPFAWAASYHGCPVAGEGSVEYAPKKEDRRGKKNGLVIASAAATLILAGAVAANASSHTEKSGGDKVMCEGINECKGKGVCGTAENSCAGENACKG